MSTKERILAEIKKKIEANKTKNGFPAGTLCAVRIKEQDQPITGNSLEQEWLRYVDRKKKECGGELPALGEYGWLQIARHFAKWQKEQMMKEAVEGRIHAIGLHNAIYIKEPEWTDKLDKYEEGDKVLVIVLPKEVEK